MPLPTAPVVTSVDVTSKIVAVTVYENRAQVHRQATVTLGKGDTTLVFDDIPDTVDKDTVQVTLRTHKTDLPDAALALNGITYGTRDADAHQAKLTSEAAGADTARKAASADLEAKQAQLTKLKDELEELLRKDQNLKDELQFVGDESRMHEDFFAGAVAQRTNDSIEAYEDLDLWKGVIESKMASDANALERRREVDAQRKALGETMEKVREQIQKMTVTPKKKGMVPLVNVHLQAQQEIGSTDVLVSYMMPNASWKAAYDIRVDRVKKTAEISYQAIVRQTSVEDWDDVGLTMSTAKPSASGRAPDLSRWHVSVAHPVVTRSSGYGGGSKKAKSAMNRKESQVKGTVEEIEEDSDFDDDESEAVPAATVDAEVKDGATSVSFDVPHRHSIPRDNKEVRVPLTKIMLNPDFSFATRPSSAELCYGILNATNPSSFTLMPGEANVFVDGQFITRTSLPRVAAKNAIRIGIGEEASISVRYKAIKEHTSDIGGMLSTRKKVKEYTRQAIVKNLKDEPITVRLEHEVPSAEDSRIEVKVLQPTEKELKSDSDPVKEGKLILPLQLRPREEVKVNIVIAVTYPADMNLEGL